MEHTHFRIPSCNGDRFESTEESRFYTEAVGASPGSNAQTPLSGSLRSTKPSHAPTRRDHWTQARWGMTDGPKIIEETRQ